MIDVGGRLRRKIGEADQRDLDPIKTRYLFLRSFKNVLKHKKANGQAGAGRREGLKEAETPESRLVEDEEQEGEKERDWWRGGIYVEGAQRGVVAVRGLEGRGGCA